LSRFGIVSKQKSKKKKRIDTVLSRSWALRMVNPPMSSSQPPCEDLCFAGEDTGTEKLGDFAKGAQSWEYSVGSLTPGALAPESPPFTLVSAPGRNGRIGYLPAHGVFLYPLSH